MAAVGILRDEQSNRSEIPKMPLGAAAATLASGARSIYTHFLFQVHDYRVKERVVFSGSNTGCTAFYRSLQ